MTTCNPCTLTPFVLGLLPKPIYPKIHAYEVSPEYQQRLIERSEIEDELWRQYREIPEEKIYDRINLRMHIEMFSMGGPFFDWHLELSRMPKTPTRNTNDSHD